MPPLVPVTADNFARAETDMYFAMFVKRGALGGFIHFRELPPIDLPSVRPNRDTLYSHAVFDLDAGPVEITLPDPGERFVSMIIIDQDHYVSAVVYGAGSHTLTRKQIGTRYVFTSVRTLIDPAACSISNGFMRRTRSPSATRVLAVSRCRSGTQTARSTSEMPSRRSARRSLICDAAVEAETRSTQSDT